MFLAPGDEFLPGEGDLVDAKLVPVKELGKDIEVLDLVLPEILEFLEVVLAGVGVVETIDGVAAFGVGDGVFGQVGSRQHPGSVEDFSVDHLVADVVADGLVGGQPVLEFLDVDFPGWSESVTVLRLELAVDQLGQEVLANVPVWHHVTEVFLQLPGENDELVLVGQFFLVVVDFFLEVHVLGHQSVELFRQFRVVNDGFRVKEFQLDVEVQVMLFASQDVAFEPVGDAVHQQGQEPKGGLEVDVFH